MDEQAQHQSTAVAQLRRLAIEAAKEAPTPRAERCWLWHEWTMWQVPPGYASLQRRHCVRCGKMKQRWA
jgi:hypothetical protein